MAQVVIVSNRLPVSVKKENGKLGFYPSAGGLATGLSSYIKNKNNRWIGWPGIASDELTERDKEEIVSELAKHNCSPVFLTKRHVDEFYNGYSNSILWPLLHNLPVRVEQEHESYWKTYRWANKLFAEVVLSLAQPGSTIWVNDYQLLLLPELLRAERPHDNIGFFLHIPFISADLFGRLAESKKLLRGMLGADLVGFHTGDYAEKFLENCQKLGIGLVDTKQVVLADRVVRVTDFPMGIDYQKYAQASKSRAVKQAFKRYKQRYGRRKVIVAVDRLEPSKGLVERLKAYKQFLLANPRLCGKVVFALVAAPSRTEIAAYKKLAKQLDSLVAEINGQFGNHKWQPVDYMNRVLPFEEVSALYQIADVAFIAPLRDGMNLVAKEYVASKRNKGVLILSETAGAAQELTEALLVDPTRPMSLVNALDDALSMPRREFRRRMRSMQATIAPRTVHHWAHSFINTLNRPVVPGYAPTRLLKRTFRAQLVNDFANAQKRLLLLDYDGVLSPFFDKPGQAKPTFAIKELLQKLAADRHNDIVIISGRSRLDLDTWFGDLPLNLVAEHGALVKTAASKSWHQTIEPKTGWKKVLKPILEKYASKTPKAFVEEKECSLVWHYRLSPPYEAQKYSVILKRVLKPIMKPYGVSLLAGNKILEIKNSEADKGKATAHWLKHQPDYILALGDDSTDEDTFAALPATAYTIKVGRGRSGAKYRLGSPQDVQALLRQLARQ